MVNGKLRTKYLKYLNKYKNLDFQDSIAGSFFNYII